MAKKTEKKVAKKTPVKKKVVKKKAKKTKTQIAGEKEFKEADVVTEAEPVTPPRSYTLDEMPIPDNSPIYFNGKVVGKWSKGQALFKDDSVINKLKQGTIFNISIKGQTK